MPKKLSATEKAILDAVKWGHLTPNQAANKLRNEKGR